MDTAIIRQHIDTIETASIEIGRFATALDVISLAMGHMGITQYKVADIGASLQAIAHSIDRLYNTIYDANEAIESEIRQSNL